MIKLYILLTLFLASNMLAQVTVTDKFFNEQRYLHTEGNKNTRADLKILDVWNRTTDNSQNRYFGFKKGVVYYPSENNIRINLNVGVCYLPLGDWPDVWNSYPHREKKEPSFTVETTFDYFLGDEHSIGFSVGITKAKATASDLTSNVSWTFTGYPIEISYTYYLTNVFNFTRPYVGTGLIYIISNLISDVTGENERVRDGKVSNSGYGIGGTIGLLFPINQNIGLNSELKLKYLNGSGFSNVRVGELDFTGIYFLLGIYYHI